MKKKRVAIIAIPAVIAAALIIWAVSYFFIIDTVNKSHLEAEIKTTLNLANSTSTTDEQMTTVLERSTAAKKYIEVEKSAKAYAKEIHTVITALNAIVSDKKIASAVTPQNLIEDGKQFVNTTKLLQSAKDDLASLKEKYKRLMTETVALEFAKELDPKLIPLYTKLTFNEMQTKTELFENNISIIEEKEKYVDTCAQIIEHLTIYADLNIIRERSWKNIVTVNII